MEYIDFDRLLKVCRLRLEPSEKEEIEKDVLDIIKYFDTLDSLKIDDIKVYHSKSDVEVLREDNVEAFGNVEGLLKNTKTYRFYVVGPKI
ncbi:MAG: Asp-tRNA(Asn)/Glu-tRNA(Gln) amidotransferase subunit GatC [Candidatus Micrarchaeia archaeon]